MNEKVTDDAVAAWLRELGYRASDGSLPTRTTLSGVSDVAADPVQFLMERYRSKSKTQSIKRYMELLDNSSDPHKADTLRKLSAAAKAKTALEEGAAKAEALSTQIKDLNVSHARLWSHCTPAEDASGSCCCINWTPAAQVECYELPSEGGMRRCAGYTEWEDARDRASTGQGQEAGAGAHGLPAAGGQWIHGHGSNALAACLRKA
jgi:hypothetical protein